MKTKVSTINFQKLNNKNYVFKKSLWCVAHKNLDAPAHRTRCHMDQWCRLKNRFED